MSEQAKPQKERKWISGLQIQRWRGKKWGVSANGQGVSFWSNKDALEIGNGDVEKLGKHTKTTELHSVKDGFQGMGIIYEEREERGEKRQKEQQQEKKGARRRIRTRY